MRNPTDREVVRLFCEGKPLRQPWQVDFLRRFFTKDGKPLRVHVARPRRPR